MKNATAIPIGSVRPPYTLEYIRKSATMIATTNTIMVRTWRRR